MLLKKDGEIADLPSAFDNLNISALAQPVEKYFLCFPSLDFIIAQCLALVY